MSDKEQKLPEPDWAECDRLWQRMIDGLKTLADHESRISTLEGGEANRQATDERSHDTPDATEPPGKQDAGGQEDPRDRERDLLWCGALQELDTEDQATVLRRFNQMRPDLPHDFAAELTERSMADAEKKFAPKATPQETGAGLVRQVAQDIRHVNEAATPAGMDQLDVEEYEEDARAAIAKVAEAMTAEAEECSKVRGYQRADSLHTAASWLSLQLRVEQ